jgi:uncharacterized membrane protein
MPTQNIARSFDAGHPVGVEFRTGNLLVGELGLEVHIPQNNSIRLDSLPLDNKVGVPPGGEVPIDVLITNIGNGEDTVSFNLSADSLPEGWSATPTSASIVLSSTQQRTQSFTIHAPADADDGTYIVIIDAVDETGALLVDEDGQEVNSMEIEVSIARANLEIETVYLDGEALYQDKNKFVVMVKNTGTLDAAPVEVNIEVSGLQNIEASGSTTTTVKAGETVKVNLELDLSEATLQQIEITAYATTTVVTEEGGDRAAFTISTMDVVAEAPDEPNSWLPWIILSIIAFGIWAGIKAMASRRGPKF